MIHILENSVLSSILTTLRDSSTGSAFFRKQLQLAGMFLSYEILNKEIEPLGIDVKTPLALTKAMVINAPVLQLVIMRAGMHLASGGGQVMDELNIPYEIGIIEAKRIEEGVDNLDFEIDISSFKVPPVTEKNIIVYEPMVATGNTIIMVLRRIYEIGMPLKVIIASVVSAPYGIEKIESLFPDVHFYTLALDKEGEFKGLNSEGYIVPGLGDCGDRAFGRY